MKEKTIRNNKLISLLKFLEIHDYEVQRGMSTDNKFLEYLKIGYRKIPEQTERKPKLKKD